MKKLSPTIFKLLCLSLALAISVVFISSCSKEKTENNPKSNNETTQNAFKVNNGIITFKSAETFVETMGNIVNLSDTEREKWEEGIGFLSQRRIISNIINAEQEKDKINESKFTIEDAKTMTDAELHSTMYSEYLNKGVIKIIDKGTENEYWDYAVYDLSLIEIMNEDGLYAIGDTLYQVTNNSLKIMKNANFNDALLLLSASIPDEKTGIYINYYEPNLKGTSPGLLNSRWIYDGDKRIGLNLKLSVLYYMASSRHYDFYHEVYVQCMQRNWLGNWKYVSTNIRLTGTWEVSVYYYPQRYGWDKSLSWSGYGNYVKLCVNPETGSTQPFGGYFGVNPNSANLNLPYYMADQYDYQPYFTSYNWTAVRDGGCCGISVNLPNDKNY
jgi:hypothetical protein